MKEEKWVQKVTRFEPSGGKSYKCGKCEAYVPDINEELWLCYECLGDITLTLKELEIIADALEIWTTDGIWADSGTLLADAEEVTALYECITERLRILGGKEEIKNVPANTNGGNNTEQPASGAPTGEASGSPSPDPKPTTIVIGADDLAGTRPTDTPLTATISQMLGNLGHA